jgi:hypothetical protein
MMEYWNNGVFQYRRTGVLARTCAGEDACTPACRTVFPHHSNEVIGKRAARGGGSSSRQ